MLLLLVALFLMEGEGFIGLNDLYDTNKFPYYPPTKRIFYGEDQVSQFGDLYIPQNMALKPAHGFKIAVLLHGGCWLAQFNLEYMSRLAHYLNDAGYVVWNLEYRRVGNGGGYPNTFHDISNGSQYLRTIASQARTLFPSIDQTTPLFDLTRVITIGHSSGGHLATWLIAQFKLPESSKFHINDPLPYIGVISLAGLADLESSIDSLICGGAAADLIGGRSYVYPDRYLEVSVKNLLPLPGHEVIMHGNQDNIVPARYINGYYNYSLAQSFLKGSVTLIRLDNAAHFELVAPGLSPAGDAVIGVAKNLLENLYPNVV